MIQNYLAASFIVLFIILVIVRTLMLKNQGIKAIEFGQRDRKDFLIIPFALFYFYLILANAFDLPTISGQELFHNEIVSWSGVAVCSIGFLFFVWALVSFKKSFRVGLEENTSQGLIATGAFSITRNPIYVAFAIMLIGQFLIFSSWIFLIYILGGIWLVHRQILREEAFLTKLYGDEYTEYCKRVRRWL